VNDFISFKKKEKEVITFAKSYIAFADPNLSDNEGVTRSSLKIDQLFDNRGVINIEEIKQLPSLPETAEEVKSIAGILDADFNDLYLQNDANEEKVKAIDLSKSKVISFATHGLVSGEIRGLTEPALVLTPPNEVSELNDGLLKSSEIALLDLNTDLVVLSACNTASSDGSPGAEGLSGLAKSFFIAGAKGILVSHWPVFSESTKDTMIKLFEEAKNDHTSYSSSLQKAKKSMIEENQFDLFAHPTFWAPFVMIGIN
jgi:CHAT domain-containing protein